MESVTLHIKENTNPVYFAYMSARDENKKRKAPVLPYEYWDHTLKTTHMWKELWELLSSGRMLPFRFAVEFCLLAVPGLSKNDVKENIQEACTLEHVSISEYERPDGTMEYFISRPDVLLPSEYSLNYVAIRS